MISSIIMKTLLVISQLQVVFILKDTICCKLKKKEFSVVKSIKNNLFYVYLLTLLSLTVIPYWKYDLDYHQFVIIIEETRSFNLIPFRSVVSYLTQNSSVDNWTSVSVLNLLGNVGLFVPIGFLLVITKKMNFKKVVLTGACITIGIEIAQYFTGRVADIDDVLLNLLGVVIGYAIARNKSLTFLTK